ELVGADLAEAARRLALVEAAFRAPHPIDHLARREAVPGDRIGVTAARERGLLHEPSWWGIVGLSLPLPLCAESTERAVDLRAGCGSRGRKARGESPRSGAF